MSSNFGNETKIIKEKFVKAEYPLAFINSVLRDFNNKTIPPVADEDEYIIPPYLFETPKKKIMFEFPYFSQDEITFPVKISWIHKQQIRDLNQMDHEED